MGLLPYLEFLIREICIDHENVVVILSSGATLKSFRGYLVFLLLFLCFTCIYVDK